MPTKEVTIPSGIPEGGKITELPKDAEEFNLIHQTRNEDGTFRIELATIKIDDMNNLRTSSIGGDKFY